MLRLLILLPAARVAAAKKRTSAERPPAPPPAPAGGSPPPRVSDERLGLAKIEGFPPAPLFRASVISVSQDRGAQVPRAHTAAERLDAGAGVEESRRAVVFR